MVGGCTLNYKVSSGPFLSFEIEIGDGPGPELDNKISRATTTIKPLTLEINENQSHVLKSKYLDFG